MSLKTFASLEMVTFASIVSVGFNEIEPLAWVSAGVLLVSVLLLSTIDLVMVYQQCKDKEGFEWNEEIVTRVFILFLIPVSLAADAAIYLASHTLPHNFFFLDRGWLFFTITTLLWLNTAFSIRILDHIKHRSGPEYIPPPLGVLTKQIQSILKAFRMVDAKRYREAGHEGDPPYRWTDTLTEEELTEAAIEIDRKLKKRGEVPLDPTKLLDGDK